MNRKSEATHRRRNTATARICAAFVAATSGTAVISLLIEGLETDGNILQTIWRNLDFFTNLANILVAVLFARIALQPNFRPRSRTLGLALMSILLVSGVYWLMLSGLHLIGHAGLGDFLAHGLSPVLVLGWWLAFASKGRMRYAYSLNWVLFPLGYLLYAIIRGQIFGGYPYFFIDPSQVGLGGVVMYALIIGSAFIAMSCVLIWFDNALGQHKAHRQHRAGSGRN